MGEITKILSTIDAGDKQGIDQLFNLVYQELKRIASQKMRQEFDGHSLQSTALVHEAFIRLIAVDNIHQFENRRHFYSAAAESMRRILIDHARKKKSIKRGGGYRRKQLDENITAVQFDMDERLAF